MAVIGWGKPRILVSKLDTDGDTTTWTEVPTPSEDSTQLTTTKGDKTEAKLEGGANEDVKYGRNTYALAYTIRIAKGKTQPFEALDGVVDGEYAVAVVPEDPNVPGIMIDKSVVSAEDTFSTAEGGAVTYTHDALQPNTGSQVKWGVISVSESDGTITAVSIAQ
ncbi:MAG: hypothetical protein J6Q39_07680 [Bacteroidales bacterium]|nr:hypothetical protein [Bacteroidales bacterium]